MSRRKNDREVLRVLLIAAGAVLERDRFGFWTVKGFANNLEAGQRRAFVSQGEPVAPPAALPTEASTDQPQSLEVTDHKEVLPGTIAHCAPITPKPSNGCGSVFSKEEA